MTGYYRKMNGFLFISKYAGMREHLIQAGGGNTSYKESDEKMYIKASGVQLADITNISGYSIVNPKIIADAFLKTANIDEISEEQGKKILEKAVINGMRPSIETFLHSVSGKYTLHTHPILVNVLTCRKNGMEILKELFPKALMVPYATPGVALAKAYFKTYMESENRDTSGITTSFLQNHGLIVSGDSPEVVMNETESIVKKIENFLNINFSGYRRVTEIWRLFPERIVWKVTDFNVLQAYDKLGKTWTPAFCPDCIVFLGKKILELDSKWEKEIYMFEEQYGNPIIIALYGELYILADSVKKALETQSVLSFSAQVMLLNNGEECNLLSKEEQNMLINWEAEKYRKTMK